MSTGEGIMSGVQEDALSISHHFSTVLLHNPLAVQHVLKQCRNASGAYNMLNVIECLMKVSTVRETLGGITCHGNQNILFLLVIYHEPFKVQTFVVFRFLCD